MQRSVAVELAALILLSSRLFALQQPDAELAKQLENSRVRVVYPASLDILESQALRLVAAFEQQAPLPGVRESITDRVTISLATDVLPGLDGWSYAAPHLIVLPANAPIEWSDTRLYRVVRHELAHISVGKFLGYKETPLWFREGFAEWIAGGVTCEGEARLRLDLMIRKAQGIQLSGLSHPISPSNQRLAYDRFAAFFEYLDETTNGAVEDGTLIGLARDFGPMTAVEHMTGHSLAETEQSWQAHMWDRFGEGADKSGCVESTLVHR